MRRMTLALLLICLPSAANAASVTVDYIAGDITGWYTFDTATQGTRAQAFEGFDQGAFYRHAITEWGLRIGNVWEVSGTEGDLTLAIDRGEFGEYWYTADMWSGPDVRVMVNIWSPTIGFLSSEALADITPDIQAGDNWHDVTLFDEKRTNVARNTWLNAMAVRPKTDVLSASTVPTRVPEPSTAILLLIGASLTAVKSRIYAR